MRRFTIVQDLDTDPTTHWRLFLDDIYDRTQYLEGFHYHSYEVLLHKEEGDVITRNVRVTPRLDLPGPVAKLFGPRFAYTEEGRFDKTKQVWTSRLVPSVIADRLKSESRVTVEPAGEGKCRRTCELTVDAHIFGIGGIVESALEKNIRTGWSDAAKYMNEYVRKQKA